MSRPARGAAASGVDVAVAAARHGARASGALSAFVARNPMNLLGLLATALFLGAGLLGPVLDPASPTAMNYLHTLAPPGHGFLFGTDEYGRDEFVRVLGGIRISLLVGFVSIVAATAVGGLLGAVAGFVGGSVDDLVMRLMDVLMAFPAILLAIGIMTMLGTSVGNVMLAIAIVYTPIFARVARAPVLALRQEEYVSAARAIGASPVRVLFRHVLPNAVSPVIVQFSLALSDAILTEAALSYLGLGVQPPTPSLGQLISDGQQYMMQAPWLTILPGLSLMVGVLAFNLLGDALRDRLDPSRG
jgi:peptide/nickel transport system permease protein